MDAGSVVVVAVAATALIDGRPRLTMLRAETRANLPVVSIANCLILNTVQPIP
jgi:hypothetical protein